MRRGCLLNIVEALGLGALVGVQASGCRVFRVWGCRFDQDSKVRFRQLWSLMAVLQAVCVAAWVRGGLEVQGVGPRVWNWRMYLRRSARENRLAPKLPCEALLLRARRVISQGVQASHT